jgi:hypothetical protein
VVAALAVRGALAVGGVVGRLTGAGRWLPKYSARGTITMPMATVRTKVTAPHSRRTKDQLTKKGF